MVINFQAKGQILYGTFPAIIAGSKGFIRAKFKFSEHWLGTYKTAYFNVGINGVPVAVSLDANDECNVPDNVVAKPGDLIVSVDGRNEQDVVLITASEVLVPILPSGKIDGTGIVVSPETQEKLDKRRAALSYTAHGNAVQSENKLYIPASLCPILLRETEPETVRLNRSRVLGNTLDIT